MGQYSIQHQVLVLLYTATQEFSAVTDLK